MKDLIVIEDPLLLVTPNRFDLMAKLLYAIYFKKGVQTNYFLQLYEEHLRLWNGFKEYNNPEKCSRQNFLDDFKYILDNINKYGFNENYPIPISNDGSILNGSHRAAACIVNNVPPVTINGKDGVDGVWNCGYQFFRRLNLNPNYMDSMALQYIRSKLKTRIVILYPSVGSYKLEEVIKYIKKYGIISYDKSISLNRNGLFNLVRQLYKGEKWGGSASNNYSGFKNKTDLCFKEGNLTRIFLVDFYENIEKSAVQCKKSIRSLFNIGNHSIHITDKADETIRIGQIVLNKNSIHFLNYSNIDSNYERFNKLLFEYKKLVESKNDAEEYCVSGSSVLALYGLRDAYDLDYLHDGSSLESKNKFISSHNYYSKNNYIIHKDDILFNPDNHFYYDGIKFASLDVILGIKEKRKEKKDLIDIALIKKLSEKNKIYIDIADYWHGVSPNNLIDNDYLFFIFRKKYSFSISEKPDVLFFSAYGNKHKKYSCLKVLYNPENRQIDKTDYDFSFSFNDTDNKNLNLPNFVRHPYFMDFRLKDYNPDIVRLRSHPKARFCNFIYSNSSAKERVIFCKMLNKYKTVDCPGKVLNNMQSIPSGWMQKLEFIKNHKFTIAFENESSIGYTTEKIYHALLVGSIPIYWGNPRVSEYFNPASFINCHDYNDFDQVIERIIQVDNDQVLYEKYLNAPPFLAGSKVDAISEEKILKRFDMIINSLNNQNMPEFNGALFNKPVYSLLVYAGVNRGGSFFKFAKYFDYAIGFEANPDLCRIILESANCNNIKNIEIINAALCDFNGEIEFNLCNDPGTSSIGIVNDKVYGDKFKIVKKIKVKAVNLYDFLCSRGIQSIDFYVSDIQGYDLCVLKTLKPFIEKKLIKRIQCEVEKDVTPSSHNSYKNAPSNKESDFSLLLSNNYTITKYDTKSEWQTVDIQWQASKQEEPKSYSQYGQDVFCHNTFFKNKKSGFFVEMGADDGVDKSNTFLFEKKGWNGLCIEASPKRFSLLKKNRSCICENYAIHPTARTVRFMDISGYGKGLSGIVDNYDPRHLKRINEEIKNPDNKGYDIIEVPAISINELLQKNKAYYIDFFSLDVEGGELEILKSLDMRRFTIDVFCIENNFNSTNLLYFMSEKGYLLINTIGSDEIYIRKSSLLIVNANLFSDKSDVARKIVEILGGEKLRAKDIHELKILIVLAAAAWNLSICKNYGKLSLDIEKIKEKMDGARIDSAINHFVSKKKSIFPYETKVLERVDFEEKKPGELTFSVS